MPSCFHFVATLARRALQGHGKHFLPIRHVPRFKFIFYCLKVIIYDGYHIVAWRFSRWCCCHIGLWSSPRILQGHKILPTNSTCTILIAAIKQIGVILLSGSNPTIRKCLFPQVWHFSFYWIKYTLFSNNGNWPCINMLLFQRCTLFLNYCNWPGHLFRFLN